MIGLKSNGRRYSICKYCLYSVFRKYFTGDILIETLGAVGSGFNECKILSIRGDQVLEVIRRK